MECGEHRRFGFFYGVRRGSPLSMECGEDRRFLWSAASIAALVSDVSLFLGRATPPKTKEKPKRRCSPHSIESGDARRTP
jgi:hypothetical protein